MALTFTEKNMDEGRMYFSKNKFGRPEAMQMDLAKILLKSFGWKFATKKTGITHWRIVKESKVNIIK
jgi:hypothetical protein